MSIYNNAPFIFRYFHDQQDSCISSLYLASYPGLLTPAFVACSTNCRGRPGKTESRVCWSYKHLQQRIIQWHLQVFSWPTRLL